MKFKYKIAKTLEERKKEYNKVIEEHPGKIGIICEKAPKSQIPDIEKTKINRLRAYLSLLLV